MRFFDEEWINSENPLDRYPEYLDFVVHEDFPESVKKYVSDYFDIHDRRIASFNNNENLDIVLDSAYHDNTIRLSYIDFGMQEACLSKLMKMSGNQKHEILYDEFDKIEKGFVHRMNFSDGAKIGVEIEIGFTNLIYDFQL